MIVLYNDKYIILLKSHFAIFLYKYDLYLLNYNKFMSYIMIVFSCKNKSQQKNQLQPLKTYNYSFVFFNNLTIASIGTTYY